MSIASNLETIKSELGSQVTLIAVSKYSTIAEVKEAYDAGHRDFGENKAQDFVAKCEGLPTDIHWHFIGHLQRNKVKYIAPHVHLIHACDSMRLLKEINKEAAKNDRTISCLLQLKIADESEKFGLEKGELLALLKDEQWSKLNNIEVKGLMAMATNTGNTAQLEQEFGEAQSLIAELRNQDLGPQFSWDILSMGMSQDYNIALEKGANMVRIGSAIFKS